jgi:hypothetical protein
MAWSCPTTDTWTERQLSLKVIGLRVARFFLVQNTKTGEKIPKYHKYNNRTQNISNGRKIDQMSIKYTNILHFKTLQNVPKILIFGLKINHLATMIGLSKTQRNHTCLLLLWFRQQKNPFKSWWWADTFVSGNRSYDLPMLANIMI